jgi:predicted transcriptional regulator
MARKKSPTLTAAEYRLMDILWNRGPGTVGEVVEVLGDPPLAYNTVLTTLRILEQKGYVRHKATGRAFVYRPVVEREDAQRDVVQHVVSRFFNNSPRTSRPSSSSRSVPAPPRVGSSSARSGWSRATRCSTRRPATSSGSARWS